MTIDEGRTQLAAATTGHGGGNYDRALANLKTLADDRERQYEDQIDSLLELTHKQTQLIESLEKNRAALDTCVQERTATISHWREAATEYQKMAAEYKQLLTDALALVAKR